MECSQTGKVKGSHCSGNGDGRRQLSPGSSPHEVAKTEWGQPPAESIFRFMPKIADFGFASECAVNGEDVRFKSFKGTRRGYMAPEVHEVLTGGEPYLGKPADVFSLGVLFFGVVFRKLPFEMALANNRLFSLLSNCPSSFWASHAASVAQLQLDPEAHVEEFQYLV